MTQFEPGRRLTSGERDALARDNERATRQTLQRVSEQIQADRRRGVVNGQSQLDREMQESIIEKLREISE